MTLAGGQGLAYLGDPQAGMGGGEAEEEEEEEGGGGGARRLPLVDQVLRDYYYVVTVQSTMESVYSGLRCRQWAFAKIHGLLLQYLNVGLLASYCL